MFKVSKKENGLNIIIVGCGKVGATLVEQLSKEGHDITVIDKKPERLLTQMNLICCAVQLPREWVTVQP